MQSQRSPSAPLQTGLGLHWLRSRVKQRLLRQEKNCGGFVVHDSVLDRKTASRSIDTVFTYATAVFFWESPPSVLVNGHQYLKIALLLIEALKRDWDDSSRSA